MKQAALAFWLKTMVICVSAIVLVVYAAIVPMIANFIEAACPECAGWKAPWMVFVSFTAVPIAVAVGFAWMVVRNIGRDMSFTHANARYLKWIAMLAAFDAAYFFIGNAVLLFAGMSHPGVALLSIAPAMVGIAISVAAAALSHLAEKASILQADSDLTI